MEGNESMMFRFAIGVSIACVLGACQAIPPISNPAAGTWDVPSLERALAKSPLVRLDPDVVVHTKDPVVEALLRKFGRKVSRSDGWNLKAIQETAQNGDLITVISTDEWDTSLVTYPNGKFGNANIVMKVLKADSKFQSSTLLVPTLFGNDTVPPAQMRAGAEPEFAEVVEEAPETSTPKVGSPLLVLGGAESPRSSTPNANVPKVTPPVPAKVEMGVEREETSKPQREPLPPTVVAPSTLVKRKDPPTVVVLEVEPEEVVEDYNPPIVLAPAFAPLKDQRREPDPKCHILRPTSLREAVKRMLECLGTGWQLEPPHTGAPRDYQLRRTLDLSDTPFPRVLELLEDSYELEFRDPL